MKRGRNEEIERELEEGISRLLIGRGSGKHK